jgi:hypothetical protein
MSVRTREYTMKTRLLALAVLLPALALLHATTGPRASGFSPEARQEKKKKDKSPLPGPATWDVKAFDKLFRVVATEYDKGTKKVKWTLELKAGARRFDFLREIDRDKPFVFVFYDNDNEDLATIRLEAKDFKGIPEGKVIKEGTRLEVTLKMPGALAKSKKVVLQRGIKD